MVPREPSTPNKAAIIGLNDVSESVSGGDTSGIDISQLSTGILQGISDRLAVQDTPLELSAECGRGPCCHAGYRQAVVAGSVIVNVVPRPGPGDATSIDPR